MNTVFARVVDDRLIIECSYRNAPRFLTFPVAMVTELVDAIDAAMESAEVA